MGTTVLNGTSWPLDRKRMAQYLGFTALVDNAYDASQISSMDQPVEVASIVTSIALHTGNFVRSEEHPSELQSLIRISYAVFCLKQQIHSTQHNINSPTTFSVQHTNLH